MNDSVEINQQQLDAVISKLNKLGTQITTGSILEQIALKIKNTIFLRTQAGKDADNKPFAPYSDAYRTKEKKTFVNLTKTGKLLNAMTQKVLTNNTAKVFFENTGYPNGLTTQEMAAIHNNKGAGRKKVVRNFFGVNDTDLNDLTRTYESEVAKIKRSLNL